MRVIGGKHRRRSIEGPGVKFLSEIRPTYDRVRENIFNLLGDKVRGAEAIDLFAGVGTLGIEALSRGAERVVFVDNHPESIRVIKLNIDYLEMAASSTIVKMDALRYLKLERGTGKFDIIYSDPPYNSTLFDETAEEIGTGRMLKEDGVLVGQHGNRPEKDNYGILNLADLRKYGKTWVSIWKRDPED